MLKRERIGILVAMDKELNLFINQFDNVVENNGFFEIEDYSEDTSVIIAKTGIGKVNAAITTTLLIERYNPTLIISTGVCGSLAKNTVNQGDIHLTSIVKYHDVWCGEPNVLGQVQDCPSQYRLLKYIDVAFVKSILDDERLRKEKRKVWWLPTISGDWFVDTKEKADEIDKYFHIDNRMSVDIVPVS